MGARRVPGLSERSVLTGSRSTLRWRRVNYSTCIYIHIYIYIYIYIYIERERERERERGGGERQGE